MTGPYDYGQTAKLKILVTDPDTGALTDPETLVVRTVTPTGSSATPSVTQISTGVYQAEQYLNASGQWAWRVDTTGPQGGAENVFTVNPSRF